MSRIDERNHSEPYKSIKKLFCLAAISTATISTNSLLREDLYLLTYSDGFPGKASTMNLPVYDLGMVPWKTLPWDTMFGKGRKYNSFYRKRVSSNIITLVWKILFATDLIGIAWVVLWYIYSYCMSFWCRVFIWDIIGKFYIVGFLCIVWNYK